MINKENFQKIMEEYTLFPFTIEWHNEAEQELNITARLLSRRALMQLVGECDRQGHDCYITGKPHKSVFVITKNK